MDLDKLGMMLSRYRNGRDIEGLTSYKIKSIESGLVSFPVTNLMLYCEGLSLQVVIQDMAMDEAYPVDNVFEIHSVIDMLMRRYNEDAKSILRKTGIHYTYSNSYAGLSIKTLLAMLKVLSSKLDFVKRA